MLLNLGLSFRQQSILWALIILSSGFWLLGRDTILAPLCLGLVTLILALVYPQYILILLALVVPFEQPRELTFWGTVYTTEVILAAALTSALWHIARRSSWRKALLPIVKWCLPFIIVLLISAVLAHNFIALKGAIRWLEFLLTLIMGIYIIRRGRIAEQIIWALVVGAVLSASIGLMQTKGDLAVNTYLSTIFINNQSVIRAAAEFGPNTLASFIVLVLPFTIMASLFYPYGLGRLLGIISSAILLAGCLATFSLTGLLSLSIAFSILGLVVGSKIFQDKLIIISSFILIISGVIFLNPEILSGVFWDIKLASWQNRLGYAQVVGKLLTLKPYFGVGPGNYRFLAPYLGSNFINPIGLITHPHSLWLSILAELGILGLTTFISLIFKVIVFTKQRLNALAWGWSLWATWGMLAGLTGFLSATFTEHTLIHDRGIHAALALAATLVLLKRPITTRRPERKKTFDLAWEFNKIKFSPQDLSERRIGRRELYSLLEQSLAEKKSAKILELGCGLGLDAINLARNPSYKVHGIDNSKIVLKLAKTAKEYFKVPLHLHRADIRHTGLAAESFDLIYSQGVLEHFPDTSLIWQEILRLIKKQGSIIIDVPQAIHPYTVIKLVKRWLGKWAWGWETQYTLGDFKSIAAEYGLEIVAARGYGYWRGSLDITWWLSRILSICAPGILKKIEKKYGAYWMMNLLVCLKVKK